jgi:hypothetical protein
MWECRAEPSVVVLIGLHPRDGKRGNKAAAHALHAIEHF